MLCVLQMTVPFFYSRNFFLVVVGVRILTQQRFISTNGQTTVPFFLGCNFSGDSWCSYFDTTDGYLRFIPTDRQTAVPFFLWS